MEFMKRCFICGSEEGPFEIQKAIVPLETWPDHAEVETGVNPVYTHEYPVCQRCFWEGLLV